MTRFLPTILLSACSSWTPASYTALAASSATIACDGAQTMTHAVNGWRHAREENPLLGSRPAPTAVGVYFVSALALNVVAHALLPSGWREMFGGTVAGVEAYQVRKNLSGGVYLCGGSRE